MNETSYCLLKLNDDYEFLVRLKKKHKMSNNYC